MYVFLDFTVRLLTIMRSAALLAGEPNRVRAALHCLARNLANSPNGIQAALHGLTEHAHERGHFNKGDYFYSRYIRIANGNPLNIDALTVV